MEERHAALRTVSKNAEESNMTSFRTVGFLTWAAAFHASAALAAWLLLADATALAAEGKPPQADRLSPVVTRPAGTFQAAWLSLAGAGEPCRVFLAWRDGKPVQFWSTKIQLPGGPKPQGVPKLLVDGLRGDLAVVEIELRLVSVWAPQKRLALQTLSLNLAASGRQLSSAWTLKSDGKEVSKGTVTGELRSDTDGIAAGQDWPAFHGVKSACAGPAYGKPLVADLSTARPVWRSEAVSLSGWGTGADARYRERAAFGTLCGGSSSPVVADGMIYLYHYLPSGDVTPEGADAAVVAKFQEHPVEHEAMRRWYSKRADVVVTAIDGATGRTVWESVWPGKQGNWQTHKWRGDNFVPAVADGVLVVADYSWNLYAHDAKTGALLWTTGKNTSVSKDKGNIGPLICNGVVVWTSGSGTQGLDLRTGTERWKAPGSDGARRLKYNGKDAVLLCGPNLHVIDPATGTILAKGTFPSARLNKDGKPDIGNGAGPNLVTHEDWIVSFVTGKEGGQVVAMRAQGGAINEVWRNEVLGEMEDGHIGLTITANGRIFTAFKDKGARLIELPTGKTLGAVPEHLGRSNPTYIAVDDWVLSQPECQHGKQSITLFDTTAGTLRQMHEPWSPPHNDTTAYGEMPTTNVIVDGRLIVRGMDGTYCYDLRKP